MDNKIEYFDNYEGTQGYGERRLRDYSAYKTEKRGKIDLPYFIIAVVILTIGVIMVLSASYAREYYTSGNPTKLFYRQAAFAVGGIIVAYIASLLPSTFYRRFAFLLLGLAIVLLALVPVIGVEINHATRWIDLKVTTFQPSELAKIAVILSFSALICIFKEKMATFKYGVGVFAIILMVIVGLLMLEPHLSASIIIVAVGGILMFVGGTKKKWIFLALIVAAGGVFVAVKFLGYAGERIETWKDPFADTKDTGYQIVQSLYAIGSGGLTGLGIGQGRQKFLYLPEEYNDFIFSIVCEELGYIGAVLILLLFALFIIRGYWIALHARDRFSSLVATGITSLMAIQVFLNISVVTNLIPCTGVSLPFFSYGGTALLVQMAEVGIVLCISREIPMRKVKEKDDSAEDAEKGE